MLKEKSSERQMSEAFVTTIFLAMSGGFQDAYTYFVRDKVFSNAQTGNVVLLSNNTIQGKYMAGLRYLLPLIAFALGIFVAELIRARFGRANKLHWRQIVIIVEMIILTAVGFLGVKYNMLATMLVSLSCAMQVQTFRKVGGYSYASTMCIGNLRSAMESLTTYLRKKNREQLKKSMYYFGVIAFFAIGAGLGGKLSMIFGIHSIFVSPVLLFISFIIMNFPVKEVS